MLRERELEREKAKALLLSWELEQPSSEGAMEPEPVEPTAEALQVQPAEAPRAEEEEEEAKEKKEVSGPFTRAHGPWGLGPSLASVRWEWHQQGLPCREAGKEAGLTDRSHTPGRHTPTQVLWVPWTLVPDLSYF